MLKGLATACGGTRQARGPQKVELARVLGSESVCLCCHCWPVLQTQLLKSLVLLRPGSLGCGGRHLLYPQAALVTIVCLCGALTS